MQQNCLQKNDYANFIVSKPRGVREFLFRINLNQFVFYN